MGDIAFGFCSQWASICPPGMLESQCRAILPTETEYLKRYIIELNNQQKFILIY